MPETTALASKLYLVHSRETMPKHVRIHVPMETLLRALA